MPKIIHSPRTVEIDITNYCNLRCLYCSHFNSSGDVKADLSTSEWLQFFNELKECAVMNVVLEGGEPFSRKDFFEIINGIVRNKMRFSILSNGTLITEEHALFLAKTKRCDNIQISIDGATPEINDSCRGKGTFVKAVNAIMVLRNNKLPVSVRVTIHHYNVNDLENIAYFLLEKLQLPGFSTNSASYLGSCCTNSGSVQLSVEDRVHAMKTLLMLNRKYNGRISAQAGPLSDVLTWKKMLHKFEESWINDPKCHEGYLSSCGGVYTKIGVRADGVIVPCIILPQIELGQINRDRLETVWQTHPELEKLRHRLKIPLAELTYCRECKFKAYCRGGCPGLSATYTGDVMNPSPDSCLKHFLEEGGEVPDI